MNELKVFLKQLKFLKKSGGAGTLGKFFVWVIILTIHLKSIRVKWWKVKFPFTPLEESEDIISTPQSRITCYKNQETKGINLGTLLISAASIILHHPLLISTILPQQYHLRWALLVKQSFLFVIISDAKSPIHHHHRSNSNSLPETLKWKRCFLIFFYITSS